SHRRLSLHDALPILLDLVVEVHQDLGDLAGDLAADGDRGNRAQGTGGRDRDADVAALHRRGPVTGRVAGTPLLPPPRGGGHDHEGHDGDRAVAAQAGAVSGHRYGTCNGGKSVWSTHGREGG